MPSQFLCLQVENLAGRHPGSASIMCISTRSIKNIDEIGFTVLAPAQKIGFLGNFRSLALLILIKEEGCSLLASDHTRAYAGFHSLIVSLITCM